MQNDTLTLLIGSLVLAFGLVVSSITQAADVSVTLPPGVIVPEAAQPAADFDVARATDAYLAVLTPEQRARSDAYFEGGYWLLLWNWAAEFGAALLILLTGWAARLRDRIAPAGQQGFWRLYLFAAVFLVLVWLITLPLSIYENFFREHQYGSSNQTFVAWFVEQLIGLAMFTAMASFFIAGIYRLMQRVGSLWWAWTGFYTLLAILFIVMITPVFISPAFNDYRPLPQGPVRDAVLSLARASGVPAHDVKWYDQSKQTKRISAHVSGLAGTTRIALNDNLLNNTSLPEIRSVMAHEMGHYVLNHSLRHTVYFTLVFLLGYFIVERLLTHVLARRGEKLGIRERSDPATLPILMALMITYLFFAQPVLNRIVLEGEEEADLYALTASREPHGFSTVAMRLGSYRKLEPGTVEKLLFYDHPSGRDRVEMSMRWLKENQDVVRREMTQPSIQD
jgi:STE24 endopeptidase